MSNTNRILIDSLAIGGYRSYGNSVQRFEQFDIINLFIGRNNCGKSNVLHFIENVFQPIQGPFYDTRTEELQYRFKWGEYDSHSNEDVEIPTRIGFSRPIPTEVLYDSNPFRGLFGHNDSTGKFAEMLLNVLKEKASLDGTDRAWFYHVCNQDKLVLEIEENWTKSFDTIKHDGDLNFIWSQLNNATGGGAREPKKIREILGKIVPKPNKAEVKIIPAIRKIEKGDFGEHNLSGSGIIEQLAYLQSPDTSEFESEYQKFENINKFLQDVTDIDRAMIRIPDHKKHIAVHIDNLRLPLENLGTGIHEVIILAVYCTLNENKIVCIEEPELHLNPILQKKLIRYLIDHTSNQYFITTHSPSLMDTEDAEIYHIRIDDGQSIVERVSSDRSKSTICKDLGYHPSDLLQANCIIWVEGPSDRVYLNHWLSSKNADLKEGIHYSIMFYGGKLLSHLSGADIDEWENLAEDLISLRRLNRRGAIIIDSDKSKKDDEIRDTKIRLENEFNDDQGFAWITSGREIENYIPLDQLQKAIESIHRSFKFKCKDAQFGKTMKIENEAGEERDASKVRISRYIANNFEPDWEVLQLGSQIDRLIEFIVDSNPAIHISP